MTVEPGQEPRDSSPLPALDEGTPLPPFATEETLFETYRRAEKDAGPRLDLLTFRLGPEEYGAPVEHLVEVCRAPALTKVPRSPATCLGLFSLRGTIVPVIDLKARLGVSFPARATGRERVIIARMSPQGEGKVGMLVDELVQVVRVPTSALQAPPHALGGVAPEMIQGIVLLEVDSSRKGRGEEREMPSAAPAGEVSIAAGRQRMVILLQLEKVLDAGKLGIAP